MSKQFLAVIAVIVIIFLGIFISSNNSNSKSSGSSSSLSQHIEGSGQSGVKLVEYGDYQCPFCGQYYPVVKQVAAQFNNQITFQFRNFPLTNSHPNAFAGARAAEAAALQNKFWQMHDLLYEQNQIYYNSNQTANTWIKTGNPLTFFDQYAKQLGLNVNQFNKDYASDKVNNIVNADMNEGNKLNVQATPTFYLDGKQLNVQTISLPAFAEPIQAAINQKQQKS